MEKLIDRANQLKVEEVEVKINASWPLLFSPEQSEGLVSEANEIRGREPKANEVESFARLNVRERRHSMNDKRIMKYELVKLALQGVVSVTMTGIVDGLSQMIFRKPIKREKLVKIGNYIVSEIISGGISAVIDEEIDGIKEYYDDLEYSPSLEVRDTGEEIVKCWREMTKEAEGGR